MDTKTLLKTLGSRVRTLRERKGWSQEELARRAERHFTYVGRIERGEQNVTVEVLHELAEALGTTAADLLSTSGPRLLEEWAVTSLDIVEAISHGFRAQVDVKGKLAELMLHREILDLESRGGVTDLEWLDEDGKPDFTFSANKRRFVIECKNVRSVLGKNADTSPIRVELQKTRNSKDGSPTRGYLVGQFDVLSACLFNRTGTWTFMHIASRRLERRSDDARYLKVMQIVPTTPTESWKRTMAEAMADVDQ